MATLIQAQHRGHQDRNQRWARLARADLLKRYGALHPPGGSQRQAATMLDVPRRTRQAWRAYQDRLAACPEVGAFVQRGPGLAFLPPLVLACHLVGVELGACGMRLGCLWLQRTGLHRFVGASCGTQHRGHRHVEDAMVAYRHAESTRLAQERPPHERTRALDATCTGGLCMVGRAPERHSMVLEPTAPARDHDPWQALMAPALAERHGKVMQAPRDAAPGLLAYVAHHLGAHHAPDLCHGQHALRNAVSAPMAATQRAAAQAIPMAAETRKQGQAPPPAATRTRNDAALAVPHKWPRAWRTPCRRWKRLAQSTNA